MRLIAAALALLALTACAPLAGSDNPFASTVKATEKSPSPALSTSGAICADLYANSHVKDTPGSWDCLDAGFQKSWSANAKDDRTLYAALQGTFHMKKWRYIGPTSDGGYVFDISRPGAHELLMVWLDPDGKVVDDGVTFWGSH